MTSAIAAAIRAIPTNSPTNRSVPVGVRVLLPGVVPVVVMYSPP